jgi:hypothetical protein
MPNPSGLNAKFAPFAERVPLVGNCATVTIPEITSAFEDGNIQSALAAFTEWADANGMKAWQLNIDFFVLGRRI